MFICHLLFIFYLLLWNIYSDLLSIFLSCLFSYCWVLRVLWLFLIQVLYQISIFQIFSAILGLDFFSLNCVYPLHHIMDYFLCNYFCTWILVIFNELANQKTEEMILFSYLQQSSYVFVQFSPTYIMKCFYLSHNTLNKNTDSKLLIFHCLCCVPLACYDVTSELFIWLWQLSFKGSIDSFFLMKMLQLSIIRKILSSHIQPWSKSFLRLTRRTKVRKEELPQILWETEQFSIDFHWINYKVLWLVITGDYFGKALQF